MRDFAGRNSEGDHNTAWSDAHDDVEAGIVAWNMMGGEIDWSAFAIVAAMLGVDDVEIMIRSALAVRDGQRNGDR